MVFQEALQSPCKVQEGFDKATQKNSICAQHLKQQEVPELLSKPESSGAGNLCPYRVISRLILLSCVILK